MRTLVPRVPQTPEELLLRFRATRDPEALGALFDATAPSLLRVALSVAPDAASAENALQETFLAVLEAPERWDAARPVMPWLLGILHNQVGKVRRDGARRPDPLRLPPPLADDPSDAAASREDQERVRAAIDELPEPYRNVALLRWRHGLDPADIAHVRGEPPGTTRSLLSRALEKLRARLAGSALALLAVPPSRGLAQIRASLVSKAATSSAAAAGAAAVVVAGGLVMKKIVAACAVLLLLGGGTWWTVTELRRPTSSPTAHADAVAAATTAAERRRKHAAEIAASPKDALPPVDLDKCDRDLDLFGRVVSEDGTPVAGADVETLRYPWRGVSTVKWNESEAGPTTRTSKDGTFALRLLRGERFDLRVTAEPFGPAVRADCQAGERVEIVLRRGATLDVTAMDEAGSPVPGVRVELRRDQRRFHPLREERKAVTDDAGHAAIAGLLPGPFSLYFLHPTLGEPKYEPRTLPTSGTLTIRVTMRAGRTMTGRVTDAETGKPIAGAKVDNWNFQREVLTDAEGRYRLPGWTSHETMPVAAKADGYCSAYKDSASGDVVDFALQPGDRVTGRLVDEHGAPSPGRSSACTVRPRRSPDATRSVPRTPTRRAAATTDASFSAVSRATCRTRSSPSRPDSRGLSSRSTARSGPARRRRSTSATS
jgi:RNA polymerase sigma-70 factor (ECF subfamily)